MKTKNKQRILDFNNALSQLDSDFKKKVYQINGLKNGEGLFTDEAESWKRVLNLKIAKELKECNIYETHPGKGINLLLLKTHKINYNGVALKNANWIDIDPYGFPYEFLNNIENLFSDELMLTITSGEIMSVVRNLKNTKTPTHFFGKTAWKWVVNEYIPYIENFTGMQVRFFYAFPTSIRLIVSNLDLDYKKITEGCPKWMWWFSKYAQNEL